MTTHSRRHPARGIDKAVAMRPIRPDEIAAENARQQAANLYTNIDPYVEETGIDQTALAAIRARLDGEFDHPALMSFGPLADTFSDVIRIAEAGIRGRIQATPAEHEVRSVEERVRALCSHVGIRLVEAQEDEVRGRWDWIDAAGNASDASFDSALSAGVAALHEFYAEALIKAPLHVLRSDAQFIAYVEAHLDPAIRGTFTKQAWNDRNYAVDLGVEDFDATAHVLAMSLDDIQALKDNDESTDEIGRAHVGHDGPYYVVITEAIARFFEVEMLQDITEDMLDAKREVYGIEVPRNGVAP